MPDPSKLLADVQACGLEKDQERDLLYLATFLGSICEAHIVKISHRSLCKSTGLSWERLDEILSMGAINHFWIVREDEKQVKRKDKTKLLFDLENQSLKISMSKYGRWWGKDVKEQDPFELAARKACNVIKFTEPDEKKRWKPTGDLIRMLWDWWLLSYQKVTRQYTDSDVSYHPSNFKNDMTWLGEVCTFPKEIIIRAGKAVLMGQTSSWKDPSGKAWYMAGQVTIRAWLEACKRMCNYRGLLHKMRSDALATSIESMARDGKIDGGAATSALRRLVEGNPKGAIGLLKEEGVVVSFERSGIEEAMYDQNEGFDSEEEDG